MDYFKVVKKNSSLPIAITHVHTRVHLHAGALALFLVVAVVKIHAKECVLVVHHVLVEIVVPAHANQDAGMPALILVKMDVQGHAVQNAGMIVGEHALQVVTMDALVAIGINHEFNNKENRTLAIRHSEEHHLHRHEGLPVGLQILLPRWQKRERTHALGGSQDLY